MSNGVRSQSGDSLMAGSGCALPNPHLTRALLPVPLPRPLPQLSQERPLTCTQEAIRKGAPHPPRQRTQPCSFWMQTPGFSLNLEIPNPPYPLNRPDPKLALAPLGQRHVPHLLPKHCSNVCLMPPPPTRLL